MHQKRVKTAKATHKGTCQYCNAIWKLPNGLLSKHGYRKGTGSFESTCPGSGHPPFERSCAYIESLTKHAELQAETISDRLTSTKDLPMHMDVFDDNFKMSTIEVVSIERRENLPRGKTHVCLGKGGTEWPIQIYDGEINLQERINNLKARTARMLLAEFDELNAFLSQHSERVQNWESKPLIPITD